MSLLFFMIPVSIVTVLVVLVMVVIGAFQKDNDTKFAPGQTILAGIHFIALLTVVLSILQISFVGIEKWIPDLLTDDAWRMQSNTETARYALSILIVTTPLYLITMWKGAQAAKVKVSWIKKFMATAILLISGAVVIGTLITFVYNFLSGELGLQTFVKILSLTIIAGGVAAYYQIFVRGNGKKILKFTKIFGTLVIFAMTASVVIGFVVTGGPTHARAERFDDERLSDLSSLQSQIQGYFQQNGTLPASLTVLHDATTGFALPADPRTKGAYEYRVISTNTETAVDNIERTVATFELCATFETERNEEDDSTQYNDTYAITPVSMDGGFLPGYYRGDTSPHWNHPPQKHCFERTIKRDSAQAPLTQPFLQ